MLESHVVRLPPTEAIIDLLQNHRELKDTQHFVIANMREIAAGLFGIAIDELITSVPTRLGGEGPERLRCEFRRCRPSPVAKRQSKIRKRIAGCAHFPVEHRLDALSRRA